MTGASILNVSLNIYRKFHITIDRQFIEAPVLFRVVIAIDDMAEHTYVRPALAFYAASIAAFALY